MQDSKEKPSDGTSRVDWHTAELAAHCPNPRQLAGIVAGTSEETAALFSSGHTLAADNTGEASE